MTEKQPYGVREGIQWVAGKRVPHDRLVSLTVAEARYDLDLARIEPLAETDAAR